MITCETYNLCINCYSWWMTAVWGHAHSCVATMREPHCYGDEWCRKADGRMANAVANAGAQVETTCRTPHKLSQPVPHTAHGMETASTNRTLTQKFKGHRGIAKVPATHRETTPTQSKSDQTNHCCEMIVADCH